MRAMLRWLAVPTVAVALHMDALPIRDVSGFVITSSVLHDGVRALPGAIEAVSALEREYGAANVVVASGSRADAAEEASRLRALGFESLRSDRVTTAGDLFVDALLDAQNSLSPSHWRSPLAGVRTSCAAHWFLEGSDDDRLLLERAGSDLATALQDAGFMLSSGPSQMHTQLVHGFTPCEALDDDAVRVLRECLARELPLVELASDHVLASPVSQLYSLLGGKVIRLGKRELFNHAWRRMGDGEVLRKSSVLVVTDCLTQDVGSALKCGFVPCFVRSPKSRALLNTRNLCHFAQIPSDVAHCMIQNHDSAWCLETPTPHTRRRPGQPASKKDCVFLSVPHLY